MANWSDKYIGRMYEDDTYDCASLAADVAVCELGIHPRLPKANGKSLDILALSEEYAKRVSAPVDRQPCLMRVAGGGYHIGIMMLLSDKWWVLHAVRRHGVIRERLEQVRIRGVMEGYYIWK